MKFANRVKNMQPSDIREIGKLTANPEIISFAGGMPDPNLFPIEELRKISDVILKDSGKEALQYNSTEGYVPLRKKIAAMLENKGIKESIDNIIILSGAQQGIDFCGKVLLNEGDVVICESPSYSGALNAFSSYLPEFVEITTDNDGMIMKELEEALETKDNIKIIYVIPDFQNPTGRTWSLERRYKLMELANKFDITVIEDDPYSVFRFEGEKLPTLKSLDTQNRVIYLGTFSKTMCPGLRVGWMAAGDEILSKIIIGKQVADIHTNSFAQRQIDKFLELYSLDEQIEKINKIYKRRRDIMLKHIEDYFPRECKYTRPEGGMFIWVELPEGINTREVLLEAVKEKVAYIPGGGFFPNGGGENTIRLNFSNMPDEKIQEGIKRLGNVLNKFTKK